MEKYDITDYLKDDKELQKAVIEEFLKEIAELKAENDRLRTCLDLQRTDETNQYITKVNVERKNYKLRQTLQEIRAIATECTTCGDCCECKYWEDCDTDIEEQALGVCRMILDLITKAEEE